MNEQTGAMAREKKFENRAAGVQVQIECAIDKLELGHAAIQQFFQIFQERWQRDSPNGNIE